MCSAAAAALGCDRANNGPGTVNRTEHVDVCACMFCRWSAPGKIPLSILPRGDEAMKSNKRHSGAEQSHPSSAFARASSRAEFIDSCAARLAVARPAAPLHATSCLQRKS